jgi:ABC-2 type transport system ATP-binding protein
MIEVKNLVKRYADTVAVDDLTFTVQPGQITGFLGPNGAGKSTTMRLILGLDQPTSGSALIDGKPYRNLPDPLRYVGALLEARAVHPGRSAYNHLLYLAQTQGIPKSRITEVLGLVGLTPVAKKRFKGFSLGMGQRLGIAAALLGDPQILLLDEPTNGLDPEGILWIRNLLKQLATEGRTILVSSHLMSEMALTADHLVVVGQGKLIAQSPVDEFISRFSEASVLVRSPQAEQFGPELTALGGTVVARADGALTVSGLEAPAIGEAAAAKGVVLHELAPQRASLEEAFMGMTHGTGQFSGAGGASHEAAVPALAAAGPAAPRPSADQPADISAEGV